MKAYTGCQGTENGLFCYMYWKKEKEGYAHFLTDLWNHGEGKVIRSLGIT